MYGTNIINSSFSLSKIISGLSKGLSIANQVLPLYQQAKPILGNARKIVSIVKEFNKTNNIENKKTIEIKPNYKNINTNNLSLSNPVFFQ